VAKVCETNKKKKTFYSQKQARIKCNLITRDRKNWKKPRADDIDLTVLDLKKKKKSKIGERIIIFPTFAFYSFERVFSAGDSTSCLRLDGNEKEKEDKIGGCSYRDYTWFTSNESSQETTQQQQRVELPALKEEVASI
jgi:hypothetical protein